jgi:hypothetical protein
MARKYVVSGAQKKGDDEDDDDDVGAERSMPMIGSTPQSIVDLVVIVTIFRHSNESDAASDKRRKQAVSQSEIIPSRPPS